MRVERLRIGAFGRLKGLDTGDAPLPSVVVVHGPNEAGKTTFFHFLTSLLYGFQPATRDSHPYAPWEGGEVEGGAILRLSDGDTWEVRRRLLSSPSGSLVRDGREEDLRNRALPCAEHVPRTVFRQVFALTLAELAGLEGESWSVVQDRLLGAMGATDLRPARLVAAELEREANELWRPNRRGKQKARELRERILELRRRREVALDVDRVLRDRAAALEVARAELAALREERASCRAYLERYRTLLPVRAQIQRIDALEIEAGNPSELEEVSSDPKAQLDALASRLAETEELLARNTQEMREPRARIESYGRAEEELVHRAEAVRALSARALGLDSERIRQGALEQEIRDLDRRSSALASELLRGPLDVPSQEALSTLSIAQLREAVRSLGAARDARSLADETVRNLVAGAKQPPPAWAVWSVLLAALVVLLWGLSEGSFAVTALGALTLASGATLTLARSGARQQQRRVDAARTRAEEATRSLENARAGALAALGRLALRDSLASSPDLELAGALERLQELLRDLADRRGSLAVLQARANDTASAIESVARELRLELPRDSTAAAHLLAVRLREAEGRREAAAASRRELERLVRARRRLEAEHERVLVERDRLLTRLEALGGGDAVRGIDSARQRWEAWALARRLRDELVRAHPDVNDIRARIAQAEAAGEGWTVDDEALGARRSVEEALTDQIESLTRRTEALAHEVERLREAETADAVDGEILLLEEELSEIRRERDRRWLLARVLREADRRFRDEHQPDIVREAGVHLDAITGGRYRRILVGDGVEGSFLVQGPGSLAPVKVGQPLSTGTREQVYLALRLAIVDHLDQGGERLPLFMDEAFVNWDADRLGRGLSVLREVARHRQLFLFSCHEDVVEELGQHGARVLRLDRAS